MGIKINEVDFQQVGELLEDATFEESLDILGSIMEQTVKNITVLVKDIIQWQEVNNEIGEEVKNISKAVVGFRTKKNVIGDILKGKCRGETGVYWKKEKSKLKLLTEKLRWYIA